MNDKLYQLVETGVRVIICPEYSHYVIRIWNEFNYCTSNESDILTDQSDGRECCENEDNYYDALILKSIYEIKII